VQIKDTVIVSPPSINQGFGLPGTNMAASTIDDDAGGETLVVFYQTEGDDIAEFGRDLEGGAWSYSNLPLSL
jgi:hypothetical protein